MSRYSRNALILAKLETTVGVDAAPVGATDAVLVANLTINPLKANNVSRDLVRPFFGGSEQLVGTATVEVSFDVELAASGTAGTAPACGSSGIVKTDIAQCLSLLLSLFGAFFFFH